jgi:hypothetical protein
MAVPKPNITRISIPTNHYGHGRAATISQISEHHVVGDAVHVINKARSKVFSTTFTIAMDGTIYQLVEINDTPFCDNDWRSNARSITIEHAGGLESYPYTEAMYKSSIALHAWLFETYGQLNCVRHRDIPEILAQPAKATACPGQLNVEYIVNEAKKLLTGGSDVVNTPDEAAELIRGVFKREPAAGEIESMIGRDWKERIVYLRTSQAGQTVDYKINNYDTLARSVLELQIALQNAENKPPVEVIKEIEKICEKPAELANDIPPSAKKENWFTKLIKALSR